MRTQPTILLVGGSDSSGQAGLSSDLRAAHAVGVHARLAVTAITAQGSTGLRAVAPCPTPVFIAQLADLHEVRVVKTGMLVGQPIISALAEALGHRPKTALVIDPVMHSSAGHALIDAGGLRALRERLIPRARLLTPNLPEAAYLLDRPLADVCDNPERAATDLLALGCAAVLLKGGHGLGPRACDVLAEGSHLHRFERPRLAQAARGTGCFLATAIAAELALDQALALACERAGDLTHRAIQAAYASAGGLQPSLCVSQS